MTRGVSDDEVWSLDITFAEWIVPRLKLLKEVKCGVPSTFLPNTKDGRYTDKQVEAGAKKYNDMLDEMIAGFELYANDGCSLDSEQTKKVNRSMDLFKKHFYTLWW